jgi:hypothetical protein
MTETLAATQFLSCDCTELKDFLKCLYLMGIMVTVNFCALVILLGQKRHQN